MNARREDDEPLSSVLIELGRIVERTVQKAVEPHGLTAGQYLALEHLHRQPGISRARLARALQITPQAAGGLVTKLVDKALVRKTDARPGHPVELTATPTGEHTLQLVACGLADVDQRVLRPFRPEFAAVMNGALRHLSSKLRRQQAAHHDMSGAS